MAKLNHWFVIDSGSRNTCEGYKFAQLKPENYLAGVISQHNRQTSGDERLGETSRIAHINMERREVVTRSGTVYELGVPALKFNEYSMIMFGEDWR